MLNYVITVFNVDVIIYSARNSSMLLRINASTPPVSAYYRLSIADGQFVLTHFPPGQKGHHFTDDIFKYIFVNEKFCILIKIYLRFLMVQLTII